MNGAAAGASTLRTGSLRVRTVVAVLVLLAVLLGALGVVVQAVLGDRLRAQVEDRLRDRASAAAALVGTVDAADLADRLSMQGLSVTITAADGGSVEAGPSPDQLRHGPPDPGTLPAPAAAPARDSTADPSTTGTRAASDVTIRSSQLTEGDRIVTLVSTLSDGSRIRLTAGTGSVDEVLGELRWVMLGASAGFMLVATVGLVIVVRRTMRPLDVMTTAARSIASGDRGRRLRPAQRATEIGRVAVAFDEMLDTVEGAERQAVGAEARMRSFLSDAAHELRTPVAGITAAADTLVRARPDAVEREELAVHVVRQAGRAARLVDDLLLMARVDGGLALEPASVDLGAVVRSEADRARLRSPGLTVQVAETDGAVVVSADGDRLGQVVANLLENAARATDGTGSVVVEIDRISEVGRVRVVDDGPGIPAADRARVFERLVRLDASRAASGGGAGLGLSIARGIARAHGGDLVCPPGSSTVFVLTIPVRGDDLRLARLPGWGTAAERPGAVVD